MKMTGCSPIFASTTTALAIVIAVVFIEVMPVNAHELSDPRPERVVTREEYVAETARMFVSHVITGHLRTYSEAGLGNERSLDALDFIREQAILEAAQLADTLEAHETAPWDYFNSGYVLWEVTDKIPSDDTTQ